jgi:hypothetical protein
VGGRAGGRTGLPLPDAEGYAAGYASGQRRAAGSSRGGGAARIAGEQKRVLRDDSRAPGYTEWLETCSDPQSDGRHREQSGSNGLRVNGRRGPATRAGNEPSFRIVKIGLGQNSFGGSIPSTRVLGKISNLQSLNLSHNNLTGSIPMSLGSLRYLE